MSDFETNQTKTDQNDNVQIQTNDNQTNDNQTNQNETNQNETNQTNDNQSYKEKIENLKKTQKETRDLLNKNKNENNDKFKTFIDNILDILNIEDENDKKNISDLYNKIKDNNKLKLIDKLDDKINKLLDEDFKLAKLKINLEENINFDEIKDNWNKLMFQTGKLQALILINKLKDGNIDRIIDSIMVGFDKKFDMLNNILEENIGLGNQIGGVSNMFKYLKYKIKYLKNKE